MDLNQTIERCISEMELIPAQRKDQLIELAKLIKATIDEQNYVDIIAICTHNSRRSQLTEIWLKVISIYYDLNKLFSYSGGTEGTAFNHRMVNALQLSGFTFDILETGDNPKYIPISTYLGYEQSMFSKEYKHQYNPAKDYIALMVCDHADQNCPVVYGSAIRFSLPYVDPKKYDDTEKESQAYLDTVHEIGREILFLGKEIINI